LASELQSIVKDVAPVEQVDNFVENIKKRRSRTLERKRSFVISMEVLAQMAQEVKIENPSDSKKE
jgi:hypothetical protein